MWGNRDGVSGAVNHSRGLFLLLQDAQQDHHRLFFPPSILSLPSFHRLENQVLDLLAQIVPSSSPAILKATGGYLYEEIFAENPLLGPCGALRLFFPSSMQKKNCFQTFLVQRQL